MSSARGRGKGNIAGGNVVCGSVRETEASDIPLTQTRLPCRGRGGGAELCLPVSQLGSCPALCLHRRAASPPRLPWVTSHVSQEVLKHTQMRCKLHGRDRSPNTAPRAFWCPTASRQELVPTRKGMQ